MKLNLFGQMGLERGRRETAKLLILLTKGNEFRELWREGVVRRDEEGYICRPGQNPKGGNFTQVTSWPLTNINPVSEPRTQCFAFVTTAAS